MNQRPQDYSPVYPYNIGPDSSDSAVPPKTTAANEELLELMRQLVMSQDRQNELLEELVDQLNAGQRQRAAELGQWKEANPILARRCRAAAEALGRVQTEFIQNMTVDINDNYEAMMDGEFVLNEFVDKYGPRLAHLNGVLQLLSQLSANQPSPH